MKKTSFDYLLVGIQFFLFLLFLFDSLGSFSVPNWLKWISMGIALLGIFIVGFAILQLRNSLTAFPTPKDTAILITNGLYQWVRHPIYTGILLFVYGFSMYSTSYSRVGISFLLTILFYFKTSYEEKQLKKKYEHYGQYAYKTGRFFPMWK